MTLSEYLPLMFQQIADYDGMMGAEQVEIDLLKADREAFENNCFIDTLDEAGCERWESMLGITPLATATLSDRRFAIKVKGKETTPYTMLALKARLEDMVGADGYELTEDRKAYKLIIKIALSSKHQLTAVRQMVEQFAPCNIILDINLLYNSHRILSAFKHSDLAAMTHAQLREEVLV